MRWGGDLVWGEGWGIDAAGLVGMRGKIGVARVGVTGQELGKNFGAERVGEARTAVTRRSNGLKKAHY